MAVAGSPLGHAAFPRAGRGLVLRDGTAQIHWEHLLQCGGGMGEFMLFLDILYFLIMDKNSLSAEMKLIELKS